MRNKGFWPDFSISCRKETITFLLSLYLGTVVNLSFYSKLVTIFGVMESVNPLFIISIPFFMVFTLNFVLSLLNWRFIIKPVFILLVVSSSIVSYAMVKYGVVFDRDMIQNIFETNTAEAHAYINVTSVLSLLVFVVPPVLLIAKTKIIYTGFLREQVRRIVGIAISLAVVAIIALFFYKDYASVGRNNSFLRSQIIPTYYINGVYKYIKLAYFTKPVEYVELGKDAARDFKPTETKPVITVLVLGETARSANQSLNGYPRNTNIYTGMHGIISFKDVSSCGTATALSVPCMFSNMGRRAYDERIAKNQDNVLDVIQRAGVDVTWIENDGGCKGVCDKVPTITIKPDVDNQYCNGKTCYDEVFLPEIDKLLNQPNGNDKLIVMHIIGSHGPTYYLRYPKDKRPFLPDCQRSDIENCTSEQLINTYDNTIAYTDYVISQVIERLNSKVLAEEYNTNLVYVSDHGESLGESGLYLHGTPYSVAPDYQTKVPLMMWMSPGYINERNINVGCMKNQAATASYSHDNLFSTLLSVVGVKTTAANPALDMLSVCQK